jgi:hypothetical protein
MHIIARISIASLTIVDIVLLGACASTRQMQLVQAQHAGASFEATAYGCDLTRRAVARKFPELTDAVAWARGVAAVAPHDRTCEVSIEAVDASAREPVYLVRRDFKGVWTVAPTNEF